jgi:hypothetical protein
MSSEIERQQWVQRWARVIYANAKSGAFFKGQEVDTTIHGVAGPRAGAIEVLAGEYAGNLLSRMRESDGALMRQLIPWDFTGEPVCFMRGRYVRMEAGWPPGRGRVKIPLASFGQCPHDEVARGRWTLGPNEYGHRINAVFDNKTPHFLIAGATGAGKTTAIRVALIQLNRAPRVNRLVLLDGKMGESLGPFRDVAGRVGPIAMDIDAARSALTWALAEMLDRSRYVGQGGKLEDRIIVVFDEFQFWAEDKGVAAILARLASQGRAAQVHLLLATQHPSIGCFGDPATARELTGRLAFYVTDSDASRVAVGGSDPRADLLLGEGDGYALWPGTCHRLQGAWPEQSDFDGLVLGEPEIDAWPGGDFAGLLENEGPGQTKPVTVEEAVLAVRTALAPPYRGRQRGRGYLENLMREAGLDTSGTGRTDRIKEIGRKILGGLQAAPDVRIEWAGEESEGTDGKDG